MFKTVYFAILIILIQWNYCYKILLFYSQEQTKEISQNVLEKQVNKFTTLLLIFFMYVNVCIYEL